MILYNEYLYDAMRNRLRTTYYTRKVALVNPVCTTIPGTDNLQEYNIVSYTMLGNKRYVRYNHGSWALEYVYNPEGYIKYWGEEEHYPYYYIKDHLGNVHETYIRPYPTEKYCEQRMQYYPSGLPWNTNLNASYQPFKYNSKEFVEMHGLDEYDSEARWYYPAIMRTTTMDPLCEKYYSISPYAWCGNNPVNYVDPDGMDTIDVRFNIETNHWDLGTPIIAKGNDVVRVTDRDGNTSEYSFSEGEYGKRICSVRLESTEQQTFGMFYLSGTGFAGYSVEPAGEPNNDIKGKPIEIGEYSICRGNGPKWTGWPVQSSNSLDADRGVCIHYAGNHDENYELKNQDRIAVRWSTKCMVVSNDYTIDNSGYVFYNSVKSFNTAFRIAKYCGASGYTVRTIDNRNGNYYICNGLHSNGTIRIIK